MTWWPTLVYVRDFNLFNYSTDVSVQWRIQPKIFFGDKSFVFMQATVFCLGYRLSKHKMTRYASNLSGPLPPLTKPLFWLS